MALMRRFQGIGTSEGIAIGPARVLSARLLIIDRWISPDETAIETHRLDEAVAAADQQLVAISQQLETQHRHEGHLIVEAHRLILKSAEIVDEARSLITGEGLAAESAVRRVVDGIVATFDQMDHQYLRERGGDIEAVGERLLRTLSGLPEVRSVHGDASRAIGVGATLSAIDALHLPRAGLIGLVTERGGKTSHAAIIVRALEIPYVLGIRDLCASVRAGETLIVDGGRGEVIANPDGETLRSYQERHRQQQVRTDRLRSGGARAAATIDGVRIDVGANIETLSEIAQAVELGAESVGLFRTEFLYLEGAELPSEEAQYQDAVAALGMLHGRMVTFRTLDIGGDKLPLAVKVPSGVNPSLGVRALRFSLRRPDILRTQLRALYRASARGPLRIMFPLVAGVADLREARTICTEVREQLAREQVPVDPRVPIGAMIETPGAALTTDHLATECDFFSIGTNDLIQYAFAADRENQDVAHLYQPLHPAVLRLLKDAIDGAVLAGKPISVCGDMAGDPALTWVLLGLGIREFSMAPSLLPAVRSVIAGTRLAEAEEMVAQALRLRSPGQVEELVMSTMRRRFPLELAIPGDQVEGLRA